jgi:hypothetical protein
MLRNTSPRRELRANVPVDSVIAYLIELLPKPRPYFRSSRGESSHLVPNDSLPNHWIS